MLGTLSGRRLGGKARTSWVNNIYNEDRIILTSVDWRRRAQHWVS